MDQESTKLDYIGEELRLFALAKNWKKYLREILKPYITGEVAEVGAGLGETTQLLCDEDVNTGWLCIEPDSEMATRLRDMLRKGSLSDRCAIHNGVLADLPSEYKFDTILYIDVLEHIKDDQKELNIAANLLSESGRIVVLCPAWQHLYSTFDSATGHYRRYNKKTLRALEVQGCCVEVAFYLDSCGYFVSLINKLFLKQSMPRRAQILTWDKCFIPLSRVLDKLVFQAIGRSVITIWKRVGDD